MKNNSIITTGLLIIILITLIINKAINKGKFTCNNYILNLYLYLSLSLLLLAFISIILEKKVDFNSRKQLFFGFLGIICILGMHFVYNIYISHIIWLLFIFSIAQSFLPMIYILKKKNVFIKTLVSVVIIVLFLTIIAFNKPEYISLTWGNFLIIALIVGIVLQLVQLFTGEGSSKLNLFLSYTFVLLFSLFLLYDTKIQQVKALNCQNLVNNFKIYPNYPRESLGIFLDIINLFTNLGTINSSK